MIYEQKPKNEQNTMQKHTQVNFFRHESESEQPKWTTNLSANI